jgi:Arc/MetJ-type ribon-helix-helix transcriptional regulator
MRTKEVTLTIPEYLYEESLKLTSAGLFRDLSELVSAGLRRELQAAKELLGPEETNWQEELSRLRAQIREKRAKYGITAKSEEETLDELRAARRELWEMNSASVVEKHIRLSAERADRLSRLAQIHQTHEDQIIERALDILFTLTDLFDEGVERRGWSFLSEAALQCVWDNEEDAAYDNWRELYDVPAR